MVLVDIHLTQAQKQFLEKLMSDPTDHPEGRYVWEIGSVVTAKRLAKLEIVIMTDPWLTDVPAAWARVRLRTERA